MRYYLPDVNAYNRKWKKLSEAFHILLPIDRLGLTDFGFEYSVLSPVPFASYTDKDFAQIITDRVEDIFSRVENPMVLWSGGIDSTLIIAALLVHDKEFTVGYTSSTRSEYPWLFTNLIRGRYLKIRMEYVGDANFFKLQRKYHIITGQIGDQIIGTELYFKPGTAELRDNLLTNYREVLSPFLLDMFQYHLDFFPTDINDYADFLWFISFVFKYQFLCLGFAPLIGMDTTWTDRYTNFFDSPDMQRWAMSNREFNKKFIVDNKPLLYKEIYKRYIWHVFGDRDYYDTKFKVSSLNSHFDSDMYFNPRVSIIESEGQMRILER